MDVLTLSRIQFAITTVYHFLFVPLTLGLSLLIALMETAYVRTGNDTYKRMAQFWGRLFLINFSLGIVTGIVQEFQFGMNWSTYSRFVGDIFGAPLAIEALLAFFLESTFLGIWMFGWERLSKGLHLATIWLVVLGSNISAFWILLANSFMQEPVGYTIRNGRAEMTNFGALITNPNLWVQFPHVVLAGLATAAFFVLGISSYHLLKNKHNSEMFRRSSHFGIVAAVIASLLVALTGHLQGQHMMASQPMKMAAAEAVWNTETPGSLSILTIGNEKTHSDVFAIHIPSLLSIMAYNNTTGTVQGINQLQQQYVQEYGPGNYVPPVAITYWTFRLMVGAGVLMVLLSLLALFFALRRRFEKVRWLLWLLPFSIVLPYLANATGWIMTEVGRQPWIVFGLMQTSQAVSPTLTPGSVLITVIIFTLIYGALAVLDAILIVRYARVDESVEPATGGEFPSIAEAY